MADTVTYSSRRKITLITVCWNAEQTIADTLRSIDAQECRDFEHLIIDGGSTDKTLDLIANAMTENRRLYSGPDKGIYDAMNKGVRRANGDIIGFLNADDTFASNTSLQRIFDAFEDKEIESCYGDLVYVSQHDTTRLVRYWKASPFKKGAFRRGWCPPHPTFYARRSVYQQQGSFDLRYALAADVELMMRFLEKAKISSVYIPEVLVKMRLGGATNKSFRNILQQNREIFNALERHNLGVSYTGFWLPKLVNRLGQFITRQKSSHRQAAILI